MSLKSLISEREKELCKILSYSHWELCDCDLGQVGFHHCPVDILYPKLESFLRKSLTKAYEEGRGKTIKEAIDKIYEVYDKKYRHITRDYRTEDELRDDIVKALIKLKTPKVIKLKERYE